jgi:hypothetical protein
MKLELPTLDLSPGRILCLHIPRQFHAAGDTLEQDLLDFARRQGKAAIRCQPAGFESRFLGPAWMMTGIGWFSRLIWRYPMRRRPGSQTSMEWLSRAAGISEEESGQIISGLCERVADKLDWNAGTPRCLLGIAAALAHQPDMVIYSAVGLDAQGCRKVHGYVAAKCSQLCVLHVSYPSEYGDGSPHPRDCPPGAGCITLAADTKYG